MDFKYVLYSCWCFLGPNASRMTLRFVFRFPYVQLFGCSIFQVLQYSNRLCVHYFPHGHHHQYQINQIP